MAALLWNAHPECPEHVESDLKARVRSFPPSFLLALVASEVFDNPDVCKERLQGWALSQGFAIIKTSGSLKSVRPQFEFPCIHYGDKTANIHQLEDHVERDEKDTIISRQKQEFININSRSNPRRSGSGWGFSGPGSRWSGLNYPQTRTRPALII